VVEEDRRENWAAALDLYKRALEYFGTHLKHDRNPKLREMISNKVPMRSAAQFNGASQEAPGAAP
jgi:hypothetical protein